MAWNEEGNKLVRNFEFESFIKAFSFITEVAMISEKSNHHPEIYNVYNKVRISLYTHDAGNTVTQKDHDLAAKIDALL